MLTLESDLDLNLKHEMFNLAHYPSESLPPKRQQFAEITFTFLCIYLYFQR